MRLVVRGSASACVIVGLVVLGSVCGCLTVGLVVCGSASGCFIVRLVVVGSAIGYAWWCVDVLSCGGLCVAVRVRRPAPVQTQHAVQEKVRGSRGDRAANSKVGKKQGKVGKPPALSLDSLNLLHTHTVLSTTGQGQHLTPPPPPPPPPPPTDMCVWCVLRA